MGVQLSGHSFTYFDGAACLQPECLPTGQIHCLPLSFYHPIALLGLSDCLVLAVLPFLGSQVGLGALVVPIPLQALPAQTCSSSVQLPGEKPGE